MANRSRNRNKKGDDDDDDDWGQLDFLIHLVSLMFVFCSILCGFRVTGSMLATCPPPPASCLLHLMGSGAQQYK